MIHVEVAVVRIMEPYAAEIVVADPRRTDTVGFLHRAATAAFGDLACSPADLLRSVRRASRGFIRVEADEVSYPAHVILRYEIERALIDGDIRFLDTAEPVLAFTRTHADQTLLCVFNLGAEAQSFALPSNRSVALADSPFTAATLDANTLQLPAHAACYLIVP